MAKFDQIIRNCKIINGCGTPWFMADLAINSNKIAAIGLLKDCWAHFEYDAKGSFLTPGFIDSHTHDDISILRDPKHLCKIGQGVTTIVTGNCSFSNYPFKDNDIHAIRHLSSLLGDVSADEMCKDFEAYSKLLMQNRIGVNVVSLVGHGQIRLYVMAGYEQRGATLEQIQQMCQLLELQLLQGSSGLSLGLLSHLQIAGSPYFGRMPEAIELIEKARTSGVDLSFDMYPYTAGSSSILQLLPPSAIKGGIDKFIDRLNDTDFYEKTRSLVENGSEGEWESKIQLIGWDNVFISNSINKQLEGKSIRESANILSMDCFDLMIHVIRLDLGTTNIIMFQQSEQDLRTVHLSRLQMIGSDGIPRKGGKPHPRLFGTFPRVIGRFALKEQLIPLEEAVRRMTSLTAHRFQLYDRGLIIPGLSADLVLFNEHFIDVADYESPERYPNGLEAVWVNGKLVLDHKQLLNDQLLPGIVIKTII